MTTPTDIPNFNPPLWLQIDVKDKAASARIQSVYRKNNQELPSQASIVVMQFLLPRLIAEYLEKEDRYGDSLVMERLGSAGQLAFIMDKIDKLQNSADIVTDLNGLIIHCLTMLYYLEPK